MFEWLHCSEITYQLCGLIFINESDLLQLSINELYCNQRRLQRQSSICSNITEVAKFNVIQSSVRWRFLHFLHTHLNYKCKQISDKLETYRTTLTWISTEKLVTQNQLRFTLHTCLYFCTAENIFMVILRFLLAYATCNIETISQSGNLQMLFIALDFRSLSFCAANNLSVFFF